MFKSINWLVTSGIILLMAGFALILHVDYQIFIGLILVMVGNSLGELG